MAPKCLGCGSQVADADARLQKANAWEDVRTYCDFGGEAGRRVELAEVLLRATVFAGEDDRLQHLGRISVEDMRLSEASRARRSSRSS